MQLGCWRLQSRVWQAGDLGLLGEVHRANGRERLQLFGGRERDMCMRWQAEEGALGHQRGVQAHRSVGNEQSVLLYQVSQATVRQMRARHSDRSPLSE